VPFFSYSIGIFYSSLGVACSSGSAATAGVPGITLVVKVRVGALALAGEPGIIEQGFMEHF
jgi:hypothetical protein